MSEPLNAEALRNERMFVRVDDTLPLSWRRIEESELSRVSAYYEKNRIFPPKPDSINTLLSSLDVSDKLKLVERNDPVLARILGQLDIKLNILLRLFHPDESGQPLTPTLINLSGGGLAFWERNPPLASGDALAVSLALAAHSLMTIECYARVVRVVENDRESLSKVACRYEPILDQDRERVIQHIFKRQSELLRAQRKREEGT
ncbi:MAG: PilZ domain-containing protein [Magnetococcales bacterium]|nr:PilZ domain-containing protein [Magnetococcales bacterium]